MPSCPKPKHGRRKPKRGKRNEFTPTQKAQIRAKFNHLCQECFRPGHHIHHIMPRSRGGRAVETNALLLCFKCHEALHKNHDTEAKWIDKQTILYGQHFYKDIHDLQEEYWTDDLTNLDEDAQRWLEVNG